MVSKLYSTKMVKPSLQKESKLGNKPEKKHTTWNLLTLLVKTEEQKQKQSKSLLTFQLDQFLHKSFKTPLSRSNPSAEMLLLLCDLGISILGGGSLEKQTTTTVRLSQLLRCNASLTRA